MFKDRRQAGKLLARKLKKFKNKKDVVVIGITRGGAVVAKEISGFLNLSLDIIVIKKIGAPQNPELAIGTIGPNSVIFWDENLIRRLHVSKEYKNRLEEIKNFERTELENYLRKGKKSINVKNKKIILVDDGVATGATVLCAVKFFRKEKSKEVVLAVPVIAKDTFLNIKKYFDTVIALQIEVDLHAVGQFYKEFHQVDNREVINLINGKFE
ncbi:MAG: phosphoribosyltransferase family protein [Patescibacteria group bacterium]